MNKTNQKQMLELARKTIESKFAGKKYVLSEIPAYFQEKRGVFVTLTENGELRGCIGYIQPIKSIYDAVCENALNAAFHDPRFPPLQEAELNAIKIEISILTLPERLQYKDETDLLRKLKQGVHGVILEKGGASATFLPQVWEELPDKEEFLGHLSLKAGLEIDDWKTAKIWVYEVEKMGEK